MGGLGQGILGQPTEDAGGVQPQQMQGAAMDAFVQQLAQRQAEPARRGRVDGAWINLTFRDATSAAGVGYDDAHDVYPDGNGAAVRVTFDGRQIALRRA